MPKNKPEDKNQDWLEKILVDVDDFAAFCYKRLGLKKVKQQVKKSSGKMEGAAQDLIFAANNLSDDLKYWVKDLHSKPTIEEQLLREFKRKGDALEHKLNHVLKHASQLAKNVKVALLELRDTITSAFSALANHFKHIFSGYLQSNAPSFAPHHHKDTNKHLHNEQSFKAKSAMNQQPGIHRKILTSPQGGKRGG